MIDIIDLGITNYKVAYRLQKELAAGRAIDLICDTLIVTEHLPVITLGRRGSLENLLIDKTALDDKGIELIETDRGGDITFHGPGQLVLYPIIDLKKQRDIRRYLRMLEEVMIRFLSLYGIRGLCMNNRSGVWLDTDTKIGSIGIGVSKWVTYHGLSVNVNTPLHYYGMIRPCGLASCRMTSLEAVLKKKIDINNAKRRIVNTFAKTFTQRFRAGNTTHVSA